MTTRVISARPLVWVSGMMVVTNSEPTMAVYSEVPSFETLRDKPEISPWSLSEKLDRMTLTEEVSITSTITRRGGPCRRGMGGNRRTCPCCHLVVLLVYSNVRAAYCT